jgi:shikimate dehydrogenase
MRKLELLGAGIAHSASPGLWNGLFRRLGVDFDYGLRDISADGLDQAVADLVEGRIYAYNVTMPYKPWAASLAKVATEEVRLSGVANFLRMEDGLVTSANTDVQAASILFAELPERPESTLVLGAGATASSLVTAASLIGSSVTVANRTDARAEELAARFPGSVVSAAAWDDRDKAAARADLVVNTTPCGLRTADSPLSQLLPGTAKYLYDLIYAPEPTLLQRQAAEAGMVICDGLAHLEAHAEAMLPMLGLSLPDRAVLRTSMIEGTGRSPSRWAVGSPRTVRAQTA